MTAAECSECGETIMGPDHPCFSKEDLVEELDELARMLRSLGATDTSEEPPSDARAGAAFNTDALDSPATQARENPDASSEVGSHQKAGGGTPLSGTASDINPPHDPETHPCTPDEVSTTTQPNTTDRPDAPDTEFGAVCPACDAPIDDVRDVLDGEPCPECGAHRSELFDRADRRGGGR